MHKFIILFILLSTLTLQSQELNCTVTIDAQQTGQPNQQIFRTLETQLTEFINNTSWTGKEVKNQERIDCNMSIIITEYDSNLFKASIQVQSSRPVYGSVYDSPVYNYNDKKFSFNYSEFEPLVFNINSFDSNLISVIAFHVYTILGLDADTFTLNGGEEYFKTAKQIVNTAASSNFSGWKSTDGTQSRFRYNDALLSNVYSEFHNALYQYHRQGMDLMTGTSQKEAKNNIIAAIATLKKINDRRPNSYLLRTFFDAKSDEIQKIFSGGPKVEITQLIENLNRIAPTKRKNWGQIKY
ncbi:MAG: type IX secretion system protein PorD [Flavobacteriales bacterium]